MALNYLDGRSWAEVTREERVFCAELYFEIRKDPSDFVAWLNTTNSLSLPGDQAWEAGYEICFYRDVLSQRRLPRKRSGYSLKRTFDLCLFSDTTLIVIEAKAFEPFTAHQAQHFLKDRAQIERLIGGVDVVLLALASAQYFKAFDQYGKGTALAPFDARISWCELADKYDNNPMFLRADRLYHDKPGRLAVAEDVVPTLSADST